MGGEEAQLHSSLTSVLCYIEVSGQHNAPATLPTGKNTSTHWIRGRVWTIWFDPRTVHPVAGRYIDSVIPSTAAVAYSEL